MKMLVFDDERDVKVLFEQRFRKEIRSDVITFDFAFTSEEAMSYLYMISSYNNSENFNTSMVLVADDILTTPIEFILLKEKIINY